MKRLLSLLTLLLPTNALAQSGSCWSFTAGDGFEGSSANSWSPWDGSSLGGSIRIGTTASARSGSKAALMSFSRNEPIGGFLVIDKLFNVNQATSAMLHPSRGCGEPSLPPPPPSDPTMVVKQCQASVWILPASSGASGALQIIDPDTWTYRVSQPFNFVGRPGWTKITTPVSSLFCDRDVVARIVLNKDVSTSEAMGVDDLAIRWFFGPKGTFP